MKAVRGAVREDGAAARVETQNLPIVSVGRYYHLYSFPAGQVQGTLRAVDGLCRADGEGNLQVFAVGGRGRVDERWHIDVLQRLAEGVGEGGDGEETSLGLLGQRM